MGGDTGTAQERQDGTPEPGLPYGDMWRQLRKSLTDVDDSLLRFIAADMQTPDKVAAQVHSAEHFSVTGILGYMDFIEAEAASDARAAEPGKI